MKGDTFLRQFTAVSEPGQFEIEAFIREGLPLERVMGVS